MAFRDVLPDSVRQYLHAGLVLFGAIVMLCGVGILWAAITLAQYLASVVVLIIAGVLFVAASAIDAKQTKEDLESLSKYLGGSRTSTKESDS